MEQERHPHRVADARRYVRFRKRNQQLWQIVGYSALTGAAFFHATLWNGGSLTDLGTLGRTQTPLRDVLVHMIEEYARHCGHADLLRERIDGRVGQ